MSDSVDAYRFQYRDAGIYECDVTASVPELLLTVAEAATDDLGRVPAAV